MMLKSQDGSTVCIEPNLPSNTARYVYNQTIQFFRHYMSSDLIIIISYNYLNAKSRKNATN